MKKPSVEVLERTEGTFLEFLTREDFLPLLPLFLTAHTVQGYGYLDEVREDFKKPSNGKSHPTKTQFLWQFSTDFFFFMEWTNLADGFRQNLGRKTVNRKRPSTPTTFFLRLGFWSHQWLSTHIEHCSQGFGNLRFDLEHSQVCGEYIAADTQAGQISLQCLRP